MKIDEITLKDGIQGSRNVFGDNRAAKSEDFKTLFQGELNALTETAETSGQSAESVMAMGGAMDISAVWKTDALWNDMQAAESTAASVAEKLDEIGQLAGDGTADLKRIDDILGALSAEAANLQEKVKDLPQDHPMRNVSDELSVLAYVESVKWQRGDYL
jgi:hypothetical protein